MGTRKKLLYLKSERGSLNFYKITMRMGSEKFNIHRIYWMIDEQRNIASNLLNGFVWLDGRAGLKRDSKASNVVDAHKR